MNNPGVPPPSGEEYGSAPAEAPLGAGQPVQVEFSLAHIILVVTVNILVLVELSIAMYIGHLNRDEFSPVFFKVFFSLLVPTLILAAICKRLLRPKAKP